MAIVEVRNLRKVYSLGESKINAVDGINLSINEGEFVAIVGASGSGKSTLLNLLGALDEPTEGEIFIRNSDMSKFSKDEQTVLRRRNIGFVFQEFHLIPVLSVYENIVLPLNLDGRKVDDVFVDMLLRELKLEEKKFQMPNTLSGGQQQRVAIARALVTRPALVLADEPTGNLDSKTGMEVISLMKSLSEKFHQTLMVVTHNEEVAQMAERIIRIEDGRIQQGE